MFSDRNVFLANKSILTHDSSVKDFDIHFHTYIYKVVVTICKFLSLRKGPAKVYTLENVNPEKV